QVEPDGLHPPDDLAQRGGRALHDGREVQLHSGVATPDGRDSDAVDEERPADGAAAAAARTRGIAPAVAAAGQRGPASGTARTGEWRSTLARRPRGPPPARPSPQRATCRSRSRSAMECYSRTASTAWSRRSTGPARRR